MSDNFDLTWEEQAGYNLPRASRVGDERLEQIKDTVAGIVATKKPPQALHIEAVKELLAMIDQLRAEFDKKGGEWQRVFVAERLERERLEAERDRHRERAVIEAGIVDRVWAALGVTDYPSAGGKSIDELVSGQRARVAKLEGALRWLVNLGHDVGKNGGPPEHGEFEAALTEARAALEKAR